MQTIADGEKRDSLSGDQLERVKELDRQRHRNYLINMPEEAKVKRTEQENERQRRLKAKRKEIHAIANCKDLSRSNGKNSKTNLSPGRDSGRS